MLTRHLLLIFAIVGSLFELQILSMCLPILPLFYKRAPTGCASENGKNMTFNFDLPLYYQENLLHHARVRKIYQFFSSW